MDLIAVLCFQDRKDESGKAATEKTKLCHKGEQGGDYGLKSPRPVGKDSVSVQLNRELVPQEISGALQNVPLEGRLQVIQDSSFHCPPHELLAAINL